MKQSNRKPHQNPPKADVERDNEILKMYSNGETLQEIGNKLDITRSRVQQVVARAIKRNLIQKYGEEYWQNEDVTIDEYVKEEMEHVRDSRYLDFINQKVEEARKMGIVPEKYSSEAKFSVDIGVSVDKLKKLRSDIVNIILQNKPRGYGGKKWSRYYLRCRMCGSDSAPHRNYGYCMNCFFKTDEFKETQRESRLRNSYRWKVNKPEYVKEMYDRLKFGGNRDEVFERDKYTCTTCGRKQEDLIKRGKALRIVHIDNVKDNSMSNLKTVCLDCALRHIRHKKVNYI